jgi:hypothetical protein
VVVESSSEEEEEEQADSSECDAEDMTLFMNKFKKYMKMKKFMKGDKKLKSTTKRTCYNCGKHVHFCHTPVPKEVNQSFHTCAQDVQITRTTNSNGKVAQCNDYNIIRVYLLQNDS